MGFFADAMQAAGPMATYDTSSGTGSQPSQFDPQPLSYYSNLGLNLDPNFQLGGQSTLQAANPGGHVEGDMWIPGPSWNNVGIADKQNAQDWGGKLVLGGLAGMAGGEALGLFGGSGAGGMNLMDSSLASFGSGGPVDFAGAGYGSGEAGMFSNAAGGVGYGGAGATGGGLSDYLSNALRQLSMGNGAGGFSDLLSAGKNTLSGMFSGGGGMPGFGGSGGAGSMPWGSPGNLLSVGSSLYGLYNAEQLRKQAAGADPFGASRAGYSNQLQQLEQNPASITSDPSYQARMQAVQRSMAAQGYQGSGNMAVAAANAGGAGYNDRVNSLANLAGANIGPGPGLQGTAMANALSGQALASLGYGAARAGTTVAPWLSGLGG